ncbi:hypothetical protein SAMN05421759_11618 [Roseivivax lentus]|uniref:Uncharacterized protein n=1 Tax=Roseivivax lentus TaxID=633194 RepID=A0A1N7PIC7_9RHOB|nr:hypothetical protein [Roseivivax lentus]SIT10384.1 hypothetical protein SAMN05421759_11618 [Roseivivax lentus]
MFTIKEATTCFARIDAIAEENLPALDKALRNLSQRHYLPPADRRGRADLYPLHTICALRVLQAASGILSDRWVLDTFARDMQSQPAGPARRVRLDGGERPMSPVEEAVERVREGQTFDFNLHLHRDGRLAFFADWPSDDASAATVADNVFSEVKTKEPVATFTVHASRLIAELLVELGA